MDKRIYEKSELSELAGYQEGTIVSRTLIDKKNGTLTLFAFSEGQRLSEHTSPFDAFAHILDGTGEIIIEGKSHILNKGEAILMPAGKPHAVTAVKSFKMLLTMIKS